MTMDNVTSARNLDVYIDRRNVFTHYQECVNVLNDLLTAHGVFVKNVNSAEKRTYIETDKGRAVVTIKKGCAIAHIRYFYLKIWRQLDFNVEVAQLKELGSKLRDMPLITVARVKETTLVSEVHAVNEEVDYVSTTLQS